MCSGDLDGDLDGDLVGEVEAVVKVDSEGEGEGVNVSLGITDRVGSAWPLPVPFSVHHQPPPCTAPPHCP